MDSLQQAIYALQELIDDSSTPRALREKITSVMTVLNQNTEKSIKVSKAINQLENVTEDSNLQPFTRTQLFNIVSLLEVV